MSSQNTKLHFSAEEDEKLTESVRKHPALYEMQHALYRDTRVKDNIWKGIAEYVERSGEFKNNEIQNLLFSLIH